MVKPPDESGREITRLLQEWSDGSEQALGELSQRLYPELKQLAAAHFRRERPGGTLRPTALVNEAYLRLVGNSNSTWQSRLQFFKLASQIMRNVLVDYFRARKAQKRGGDMPQVTFEDALGVGAPRDMDLMRLEDALASLKRLDPLHHQIVEMRFFGGLTVDEVARELGLSRAKVKREWSAAKAWLHREVSQSGRRLRR